MVLWIVMVILLGIACLAFSLSFFKSEEVLLLGKSFDQNRMAALAKSALNEALMTCKLQANRPGSVRSRFHAIFPPPKGARGPTFPFSAPTWKYELDELPLTKSVVGEFGLDLTVDCQAKVTYLREVNKYGSPAYRGFLELLATVYTKGNRVFRLLERREIIAIDVCDFFDKYVLFVKYFPGFDVNRVDRRMTVTPLKPDSKFSRFSRIYLGKEKHPSTSNYETISPDSGVYLDVSFNNGDQASDQTGKGYANAFIKNIFPSATPTNIAPIDSSAHSSNYDTKAFFYKVQPWTSFANSSAEIFDFIGVKRHYLKSIVEPAIANDPNGPYGGFSAAHQFVKDFEKRSPKTSLSELLSDNKKLHQCNFSACAGFQMMVNSYQKHWKYHFAYLGADAIWDLDKWTGGTPDVQGWRTFITDPLAAKYYSGITNYITYAKTDPAGGKNIPKLQVGRMQRFWGPDGDIPALMEGDVYLRFFKVGFFDEFSDTVNLWKVTLNLRAPPAMMPFAKPGSPVSGEKFLYLDRTPLINDVGIPETGGKYPLESSLMSRAVDNIPFNRLLGQWSSIGPAVKTGSSINPKTADPVVKPTSKGGASALDMYPIVAPSAFSHIFEDGSEFLAKHKVSDKIFLDGKILIRQGPLDLSKVKKYSGCGLIRVNSGNILVGDLEPQPSGGMPSRLVLYSLQGKIVLPKSSGNVKIQASLIATSFSEKAADKGRGNGMVDFSGCKSVKLIGNLVVDHLNLDSLAVGGHLEITHDSEIYAPTVDQRYRVSISRSKTLFALDSGQEIP